MPDKIETIIKAFRLIDETLDVIENVIRNESPDYIRRPVAFNFFIRMAMMPFMIPLFGWPRIFL